jgi:hypothetical protein
MDNGLSTDLRHASTGHAPHALLALGCLCRAPHVHHCVTVCCAWGALVTPSCCILAARAGSAPGATIAVLTSRAGDARLLRAQWLVLPLCTSDTLSQ